MLSQVGGAKLVVSALALGFVTIMGLLALFSPLPQEEGIVFAE